MTADTCNPHARRYTIHLAIAMTGYCLVLFASVWALRNLTIDQQAIRAVIAVAPVLPALYGLHAFLTFYRTMDEYHRQVIAEATLISVGVVGFLSLAYGFAQGATDLPQIGLIWVMPALVLGQGIAGCFVRRRYQ
jgi:hypothetical protein